MKNMFDALANSSRLRMVRILLRGPLNVSEISTVLGLSQSNVSHSLRKLLDAGIDFLLPMAVLRRNWSDVNMDMYWSYPRQQIAYLILLENMRNGDEDDE